MVEQSRVGPSRRYALRHRAAQAGATLIEALLALALMSIAFFAIAAGLLTTMKASSANDGRVVAETALTKATEAMKAVGPSGGGATSYRACATAAQVKGIATALIGPLTLADGRAFALDVTGVAYWDRTTRAFVPSCTASSESGAQLAEVSVTVNGVAARGSVVLRNPSARPS